MAVAGGWGPGPPFTTTSAATVAAAASEEDGEASTPRGRSPAPPPGLFRGHTARVPGALLPSNNPGAPRRWRPPPPPPEWGGTVAVRARLPPYSGSRGAGRVFEGRGKAETDLQGRPGPPFVG